jgi:hypothetical protein
MEVTEFWKTLIPSQYVTITKCYCVTKKPLAKSEYGISSFIFVAVLYIVAYINK